MRFSVLLAAVVIMTAAPAHAACSSSLPLQSTAVPSLPGRAVFQAPDSSGKTQLYLFDFASGTQSLLSVAGWNVSTPINAVFSPNGKYIAFTAITGANGTRRDDYVWQIGMAAPVNLTGGMTSATKSEDSKWSPDGTKLVVKQDANIKVLALSFNPSGVPSVSSVTPLTTNGVVNTSTEASQPFYSADAKYVYLVRGAYPTSGEAVDVIMLSTGVEAQFSVANGTNYAYYPIVRDFTTIFYVGWTSGTGHADQILALAPSLTGPTTPLQPSFNDCNWDNSDVAGVDSDYVLFSSDSSAVSSSHVYRAVLATLGAPKIWDLSRIGLGSGTPGNILGLSYTAAR